jgi:hypothetical protein
VADGNLGGRLGDTERSGRRGRSSAFGGWSLPNFSEQLAVRRCTTSTDW